VRAEVSKVRTSDAGIKPIKEVEVPKTAPWEKHAWLPTRLRSSMTAVLLAMACAACVSGAFAAGANAAEWKLQHTPNPTTGSTFMDVSCAWAKECLAVGAPNLRWNGAEWSLLPSTKNPLRELSCTGETFCIALVGVNEEAQRWNGSGWTNVYLAKPPTSIQTTLQRVSCTSAKFCIAVGSYEIAGGHTRTLAESWNGTAWTVLSTPSEEGGLNYLNGVSCNFSGLCTAIGTEGGHGIALRWNGSEWNHLGTPNADSNASGDISCAEINACVAELGNSAKVEFWDGTSWTASTVPTPTGGSAPSLDGVSCYGEIECFAVGSYTKEAKTLTLAESLKGEGGSWVVVPTPNLAKGGLLASVSCPGWVPLKCTAVGYYKAATGGTLETLAERYE
jgi:hypothetical protein